MMVKGTCRSAQQIVVAGLLNEKDKEGVLIFQLGSLSFSRKH